MYLPREIISHLYTALARSRHPLSPSVLVLVSLDPDALCACRILTSLFKHDFIQHSIMPISGYSDLMRIGEEVIRPMRTTDGGSGGLVVCLGVGGLVDLEQLLGLEVDDDGNGGMGGLEFWIMDSRRPWNLDNVFGIQARTVDSNGDIPSTVRGVDRGKISEQFKQGDGGIIVFDDGDIEEELSAEKDAYSALAEMPDLDEELDDSDSDDDSAPEDADEEEGLPHSAQIPSSQGEADDDSDDNSTGQKRKRRAAPVLSDDENHTSEPDEGTPNKRRRSNSSSPIASPTRPGDRGLLVLSRSFQQPREMDSPVPAKQPSAKQLRRELIKLKQKHNTVLEKYYKLGASYSEPISSLMWNLASELGREDNDLLWFAIVGVSSLQVSGKTSSGIGLSPLSTSGSISAWNKDRGEKIRGIFRDEVRRLNPLDMRDLAREAGGDASIIPTHANSPTDMSIRLSPEPRFLLVRHWSLYESMLHSPYLSAKLQIWSENGQGKLRKLLAKMGVSITQSKQSYTHMDMELKRGLREKLLRFAPQYGLDGLIPPETRHNTKEGWGFVRCWGWKCCLSALDCAVILGAILEVGDMDSQSRTGEVARITQQPAHSGASTPANTQPDTVAGAAPVERPEMSREEALQKRFWTAYDSLTNISMLTANIVTAQHLHRAILRTGTSLIEKRQIRHLRSFRMAVVREGPDVELFTHPGALTKLALWLAESISEVDGLKGSKTSELVIGGLDETRGVYVVIGLGGGSAVAAQKEKEAKAAERKKEKEKRKTERKAKKEEKKRLRRERLEALGEDDDLEDETESEASDSEDGSSDEEEEEVKPDRGKGLNRFGNAFQEVIEETGVRVKVDSFEHCVVELQKEDFGSFLESLCMKSVVG